MRLGRRLSAGIAEDPPRAEEPRRAPVVEARRDAGAPREHEDGPQPVAAAAER